MSDMTKAYGQIINIVNNKTKSCLELTTFDGYCKAVFAFYYNDGKNASEKDAFKQLCETVYYDHYKCSVTTKANKYTTALAAATYKYNKMFYGDNSNDDNRVDVDMFTKLAMEELDKYEGYSAKQLAAKHYIMLAKNKCDEHLVMSVRKTHNVATSFNARVTVMSKYLLCDTLKLDNSINNDEIVKIIDNRGGYIYSQKVNKYTILASYVIADSVFFMFVGESKITLLDYFDNLMKY